MVLEFIGGRNALLRDPVKEDKSHTKVTEVRKGREGFWRLYEY
jgi:hypothetical protein